MFRSILPVSTISLPNLAGRHVPYGPDVHERLIARPSKGTPCVFMDPIVAEDEIFILVVHRLSFQNAETLEFKLILDDFGTFDII